eukprot:TRINITY_DN48104_c0_g1_i1.p1 TRINITY_DN48104_c0_g1~~TRINITY_DN48104_c0_g1_i1.p1  ORF type:complete len:410 (-),score=24.87 TRINITY_DN48104_c0_g1_i1:123-1352(-)
MTTRLLRLRFGAGCSIASPTIHRLPQTHPNYWKRWHRSVTYLVAKERFGFTTLFVKTFVASLALVFHSKRVRCDERSRQTTTKASNRTAVLVRIHSPSEATLARLGAWARDLHASGVDFWISMDTTSQDASARRRVEAAVANWPASARSTVRVHYYCQDDLLQNYPALIELLTIMPLPVIPGGGHYQGASMPARSLAWGFHAEAINLWFRQHNMDQKYRADGSCNDCLNYDFVWVLEDDVGFSGNLSTLIEHYASDDSDLISAPGLDGVLKGEDGFGRPKPRVPGDWRWPRDITLNPDGWCWYFMRSANFRKRIEACGAEQRNTGEHVQRYSAKLLNELHAWSAQGAIAWSEMSVPTVCAAVPGLKPSVLDASLIGVPFSVCGRVSADAWDEIMQNTSMSDRLYHALKF